LVPSLELALVKDLDCDDRRVFDSAGGRWLSMVPAEGLIHLHFESLVPIWIQRFLDDRRGVRLLCVDGNDSKGIWELEYIPFEETISSNDCILV
jgi:hypothetical protein